MDAHLPHFPTVITLTNTHNHNMGAGDALKHRDVGTKATAELTRLFEAGHSAAKGLSKYRMNLQAEMGDKYLDAAADRASNPSRNYSRQYVFMF